MNIAFVGLGKMGSAMARNLLRAGHSLTVYNRTRAKAEPIESEGARLAGSPAQAAAAAEVVMTMLANDEAVEDVVFGTDGLAAGLKRGAVHVSCSTISTALARKLTAAHADRGQGYLSAPVFGRPEAAEAKKLLVVAAGDPAAIDRCRPAFDAIGRQTFVAGAQPWQANAVKVSGNFMIASMMESFGEAFALLRKAGVDPHVFLDTMNALFGSPVYANYGRLIADQKFDPAGFALELGLKDVRLALETSKECSAPMPFASVLRDQFLSAMANGLAESDWSAVTKVAARNAGIE